MTASLAIHPAVGIALVVGIFVGVLVLLGWYAQRLSPSPELVRKLLHVAMGLVTLSFPWIFREPRPVVILAGITLLLLWALRTGKLPDRASLQCGTAGRLGRCAFAILSYLSACRARVIGGVSRDSRGEFYFTLGVCFTFILAAGDRLSYCISILLLTLADPAAALVGNHFSASGCHCKTLQGSLAFCLVSTVTVFVVLMLFGSAGLLRAFIIAVNVAIPVTFLEAAASGGLDNLLIPVAAVFLVRVCLTLDTRALAVCAVAIIGLAAKAGRRTRKEGMEQS